MNRYDGPAFARWLFAQPEASMLSVQRRRTVRKWGEGENPTEAQVDRMLCAVGIHLREVPAWAVTGWPEVSVRGLEIDWRSDGRQYLRKAA